MSIDKTTEQIRNICLLGHSGSGKTSLTEAMLYFTKSIDRMGKPTDGNTVCDYDPEEIKRGFTIQAAVAPVIRGDIKINLIDTPGYLDFVGEVLQGVSVADSSVIMVDAKAGIEVGTELAWDYVGDASIPKSFFINKFDDPDADFNAIFESLREKFGTSVSPVLIPAAEGGTVKGFVNLITMKLYVYDKSGQHTEEEIPASFISAADDYRNMLLESIAETSEELMEKFFAEEDITEAEIKAAVRIGLETGSIAPVVCGSSLNLWGIETMLDLFADSYPAPAAVDGETGLFVFKTIADPFVGKMSFFRVMSGTLTNDQVLKNLRSGSSEKMAHIYTMRGKKQTE
ncbi:MAG: GTP-binding protein, partial [Eubacteriales bacterium]|nr:GTP-binding protein [Eubacteriales bacterium]